MDRVSNKVWITQKFIQIQEMFQEAFSHPQVFLTVNCVEFMYVLTQVITCELCGVCVLTQVITYELCGVYVCADSSYNL